MVLWLAGQCQLCSRKGNHSSTAGLNLPSTRLLKILSTFTECRKGKYLTVKSQCLQLCWFWRCHLCCTTANICPRPGKGQRAHPTMSYAAPYAVNRGGKTEAGKHQGCARQRKASEQPLPKTKHRLTAFSRNVEDIPLSFDRLKIQLVSVSRLLSSILLCWLPGKLVVQQSFTVHCCGEGAGKLRFPLLG